MPAYQTNTRVSELDVLALPVSEPSKVRQFSPSSDSETQAAAPGGVGSQRAACPAGTQCPPLPLKLHGPEVVLGPQHTGRHMALSGQEEGSQDQGTLPPAARSPAHHAWRVVCVPWCPRKGSSACRHRAAHLLAGPGPCGLVSMCDNAVIRGTPPPPAALSSPRSKADLPTAVF